MRPAIAGIDFDDLFGEKGKFPNETTTIFIQARKYLERLWSHLTI